MSQIRPRDPRKQISQRVRVVRPVTFHFFAPTNMSTTIMVVALYFLRAMEFFLQKSKVDGGMRTRRSPKAQRRHSLGDSARRSFP